MDLMNKVKFDEIDDSKIENLSTPNYVNLMKNAVDFSDGLIKASPELPSDLDQYINNSDKPFLEYQYPEAFAEAYTEFYNTKF